MRGEAHRFAVGSQRFDACQKSVQQPGRRARQLLAAEFLFRQPPDQRILPVELLQRFVDCFDLARGNMGSEKRFNYMQMDSLQAYVMIYQDRIRSGHDRK